MTETTLAKDHKPKRYRILKNLPSEVCGDRLPAEHTGQRRAPTHFTSTATASVPPFRLPDLAPHPSRGSDPYFARRSDVDVAAVAVDVHVGDVAADIARVD